MKIPVVLSVVHVVVDAEGAMHVDVYGAPRNTDRRLTRANLGSVIDEITTEIDVPVRVELIEADGTTYADIAAPPVHPAPANQEVTPATAPLGLAGAGFQPGEEVALAYVVARQSADAAGRASLNLPPALLAATRGGLVMLGLTSRTVAPVEAPA